MARDARKIVLVYDAYVPTGSSVAAEIQLDNGSWTALPAPSTKQQGDGIVEYRYEQAVSEINSVKVRLTLAGTPKARPEVYDLRLMTLI